MNAPTPLLVLSLLVGLTLPTNAEDRSTEARLAKALAKFPDADANGDGKLSMEEFTAYRAEKKGMSRPEPGATKGPTDSSRRYQASELTERFEAREFQGVLYRFFAPDLSQTNGKNLPLVLSLHGAGGKGTDNLANLKGWNGTMTEPAFQATHPCFIVAPQSNGQWRAPSDGPPVSAEELASFPQIWQDLARGGRQDWVRRETDGNLDRVFVLLDELAETYPVDLDRVYVLGHSMGGFGSFEAVALAPNRFAAAVPSAGGLFPWHDVTAFSHVPIWAFHGSEDPTVPFALSQLVFEQMKETGGKMKLTRLGAVGHGSAGFAFNYVGEDSQPGFETLSSCDDCDSTADIWEWLFAQRRTSSN